MTLIERIEKLSDAFATASHPKETAVIVELGQIAEGVKELERAVNANVGIEEAVVNLEIMNIGLHWRLGDKPICDKCGGEVMLTDCANICNKCEQERIKKEKIDVEADDYFPLSVKYHWEEPQNVYFVLDVDGNPMFNREECGDEGPLNMCQFKTIKEAEEFVKKKNQGVGKGNPCWKIVRIITEKEKNFNYNFKNMAGQLKCIKCGKPETDFQQDSNGCEYIAEDVYKEKWMFLCSECISQFDMVKELQSIVDNGREPYIPSVHLKNLFPDWLKTEDGQDFLYKLESYQRKISS